MSLFQHNTIGRLEDSYRTIAVSGKGCYTTDSKLSLTISGGARLGGPKEINISVPEPQKPCF